MAIVQISKIIHRTGAVVDLPQLDIGEIGFATDEQRVFIGNDPEIVPPVSASATTQTEILTDASSLDFSRLNGASNSTLELTSLEAGQLLGVTGTTGSTTIVNVGGNVGGEINLGNYSNVKLSGGVNGYVLQTDGTGNVSWTPQGVLTYSIANVSQANPAVVTTSQAHLFGTGVQVTIGNVSGMTQLSTGGVSGTNLYYVKRVSNTSFSLYTDSSFSTAVNSSLFFPATANTGYSLGTISPTGNAVSDGSNTQIQFSAGAGAFGASANLTFDTATNILAVTGNVNATKVNSQFFGPLNGVIGATTANVATFSSVTINNTLITGGNVTANNVIAVSNGSGTNYKVGDDAYIGDINVSDTIRIKGVQDSANAYIVFGDDDTASLGRAGTGPLTYTGDFEATGNITAANVNLDTWSLFANVDGLFATDGANTYSINMTQI